MYSHCAIIRQTPASSSANNNFWLDFSDSFTNSTRYIKSEKKTVLVECVILRMRHIKNVQLYFCIFRKRKKDQ